MVNKKKIDWILDKIIILGIAMGLSLFVIAYSGLSIPLFNHVITFICTTIAAYILIHIVFEI